MERKAFHGSIGVGSNVMTAHAYVWRGPNPPASLPKEVSSWSQSQHSLILQGQPWYTLFQIFLFSPIPRRWSNLTSIFFKWIGSTTIQWWVFSSISVWNKQQVGHILWNRDHHQKSHFFYWGVAFLKSHIFGISMSTSRMFQSLEPTTPSLNPCM